MPLTVSNTNLNISTSNHIQSKNEVNKIENTKETQMKQNTHSSVEEYFQKICDLFPDLKISLSDKYKVYDPPKAVPIDVSLYSNGSAGLWGNIYLHIGYLKKASEDPAIALELEKTLKGVPENEQWLRNYLSGADTELTNYGIVIGSNGKSCSFGSFRTPKKIDSYKSDSKDIINKIQERSLNQLKKGRKITKGNPSNEKTVDTSENLDSLKLWEQMKQDYYDIQKLREEEYFEHKDEMNELMKGTQKKVAEYERSFSFDNTMDN